MTSGHIPAKDEPGPDEIIEALREAVFENPRLREMPAGTTTGAPKTQPPPPPAPKTPSPPAPKTTSPAPKTPSPAPKTPSPAPEDSGTLMNAGGSTTGPVPMMPNGSCPRELPVKRDGACYST